MNKVVGITGSGMIGRDPFDKSCWSKSGYNFFTGCRDRGMLHRAFGVEAPTPIRQLLMLKNFSFDRKTWVSKFYIDADYYRALTKAVKNALEPDDFNHAALQLGAIYNIPAVVDGRMPCYSYHDGNLAQLLASPYRNPKLGAKKLDAALKFESEVYQGMDKIFTMSEYLRLSFIEEFSIPEERVHHLGVGINLENIPPEIKRDYSHQSILFIGVDFYRKGGKQMLHAFQQVRKRLPNASLNIIGPNSLSEPAELMKGVNHLGYLNRDIPEQKKQFDYAFEKASILILPSLYEPFGIAAIEAMVNQLPPLLPNSWAFPEMVTPGENGELYEQGNIDDMVDKMEQMLDNPEQLKLMGDAGRKKVLNHYTWDHVLDRLQGFIS